MSRRQAIGSGERSTFGIARAICNVNVLKANLSGKAARVAGAVGCRPLPAMLRGVAVRHSHYISDMSIAISRSASQHVEQIPLGAPFTSTSMLARGSRAAVNQALSRLVKEARINSREEAKNLGNPRRPTKRPDDEDRITPRWQPLLPASVLGQLGTSSDGSFLASTNTPAHASPRVRARR